jgi:hypothetical protein
VPIAAGVRRTAKRTCARHPELGDWCVAATLTARWRIHPIPSPGHQRAREAGRVEGAGLRLFTTGPRARLFDDRFAGTVGAGYAGAVNSCTAALHPALEAIDVGPGDDVVLPAWTLAASAGVVVYREAVPSGSTRGPQCYARGDPGDGDATDAGRHRRALRRMPTEIERLVELLGPRGIAVIERRVGAETGDDAQYPVPLMPSGLSPRWVRSGAWLVLMPPVPRQR